jgi:hypothetical protein
MAPSGRRSKQFSHKPMAKIEQFKTVGRSVTCLCVPKTLSVLMTAGIA